MNNDCTIRKAETTDLQAVSQILSDNGRSTHDAIYLLNDKEMINQPEVYILECDNTVAGLFLYEQLTENRIRIDWLLKKQFKHRDLGTQLTRMMSQEVLEKGCDCMISFPISDFSKFTIVRKLDFIREGGNLKQLIYVKRTTKDR
ncbi:MAG: hypothetical protein IJM15_03105 [Erysipelotrichaceae bacterium]|nr:hypothetical protein [Erysipelotrichaceae bacterium]